MACPKCGCKTTYPYDHMEDCMIVTDERFKRCAACDEVFDIEDGAEEYAQRPKSGAPIGVPWIVGLAGTTGRKD